MFGELKVQLKNELYFVELSEICSANKQFAQLRTGSTSTETISLIRDGEPRTATSTFTHSSWFLCLEVASVNSIKLGCVIAVFPLGP